MTIPRVIHQIWVGPAEPPVAWIDTWRATGWEHRLWREDDLDTLSMRNRRVFDRYMADACWHGAADVARVEILAVQGGLYVDADVERLLPLDGVPWLESEMFVLREPDTAWLTNTVMGCVSGARAMLAYRAAIGRGRTFNPFPHRWMYPVWKKVGPALLTRTAQAHIIDVVPAGVFFSEDMYGGPVEFDGFRFGTHHWYTSRRSLSGEDTEAREPIPARELPRRVKNKVTRLLGG